VSAAARAALLTICEGVLPPTLGLGWPGRFTRRQGAVQLEQLVGKSRVVDLTEQAEREYPLTWNASRRLWVAELSLRVRYELTQGVDAEQASVLIGEDFRAFVKALANPANWPVSVVRILIGDRAPATVNVPGAAGAVPAVIRALPFRYQFYS